MTQYQIIRAQLENEVNKILCNCGIDESCSYCEHLSVCAMARRLKTAIADDKRLDKPAKPLSDFAKLVDEYLRGVLHEDK